MNKIYKGSSKFKFNFDVTVYNEFKNLIILFFIPIDFILDLIWLSSFDNNNVLNNVLLPIIGYVSTYFSSKDIRIFFSNISKTSSIILNS